MRVCVDVFISVSVSLEFVCARIVWFGWQYVRFAVWVVVVDLMLLSLVLVYVWFDCGL